MTYISPAKVFAHLDRIVAWQRGEKPAPVTVEWDLSNRCYLGCQACDFSHTHTRGPWRLKDRALPMAFESTGDLADVELVRRGLREMAEADTPVRGVVFAGGGEPTTHPQWLDIVEYARQVGLDVGMYTAGGLLRREHRPLVAHASWVVVSLDAKDRETYRAEKGVDGFQAACDGIEILSEAKDLGEGGAVLGVSFLLHAKNWYHAEEMLALGRSLGASYITFRPTIEPAPDLPSAVAVDRRWITSALPMLLALAQEPDVECDPGRFVAYRDWSGRSYETCRGIRLNTTVTPDGRVWVCPQRRGIRGSAIGDLRVEPFSDLWARHVGEWTDFAQCRAMCRLHLVNEQLDVLARPMAHEAFV